MLMIIFGAGASYDSINSLAPSPHFFEPYRPPLTVNLFEHQRAAWRADIINPLGYIRSLIQHFERLGDVPDFELALEEWQAKSSDREAVARKLLALRFYLQRLFTICGENWLLRNKGGTNYLELLTHVNEWRHRHKQQVCLVTFNYDTLLDHACLHEIDFKTSNMDDYIRRSDFNLIRPHGAVNWGRQVVTQGLQVASSMWDDAARTIISTGHLRLSPEYTIWPGPSWNGHLILPAIAIPLQSKAEFECPDSHKAKLEECISQTTKVLVIGWRATEKHFLSLWKGKTSQVQNAIVVNGKREWGQGAVGALASVGIARIEALEKGFSELLEGDTLRGFLEGA